MNLISIDETRDKLEKECQNLERFKNILGKSVKQTQEMCCILTKFDERLAKLEDTIAPVYEETGNLQKKQENIFKEIEKLDYVIKYYNIVNEVDSIVRAGPSLDNLKNYLDVLDKIKNAIQFFEQNNPDSIELKKINDLNDKGLEIILREFKQIISRHSKPILAVKIYELVNEQNESKLVKTIFEPIPDKYKNDLKMLAEWLSINKLENLIKTYSELKSSILERSILGLRNHFKSSSGGIYMSVYSNSPNFLRKSYQPIKDELSNKLTPKGLQQALKKKVYDFRSDGTSNKIYNTSFLSTSDVKDDPPISDKEIECYITSLTAFYKLIKNELNVMRDFIPIQHQKIILSNLVLPTLNHIVDEGESLANRVKRFTQKHDFKSALNLFPILRHITSMRHNFDLIFDGCTPEVQTKLQGLVVVLQTTINTTLEEFIEFIKNDNDTKVARDGTVHELTSNIMLFVAQLLQYLDILSRVITVLDVAGMECTPDKNRIAYAQYINRVLAALGSTLNKKGDSYSDPYLKAIFWLNNYHYILKTLRNTSLLDIVHLYNQSIERYCEDQILESKRLYSQSWSRVLNLILEVDNKHVFGNEFSQITNMRLKDKDKRIIKDKFTGFNKEIEEIKKVQKNYAIPDSELCLTLKKDNQEFIVPKYKVFYDKYSTMDFSKNTDKYLKYTPNDLSKIIDTFFDPTA